MLKNKDIYINSLATILLLSAAFFNGYPLVYSDSGTYISSGFEWRVPVDRPVSYGLFIRFFSGSGLSLWTVIIAQCLLFAWTLRLFWRAIFPGAERPFWYLLTLGIICATTALPWYSGQLMPDWCTPVQILIMAIFWLRQDLKRWQQAALVALFVFCSVAHFSNLFISLTGLLLVAVWRWRFPGSWAGARAFKPAMWVLLVSSLGAFILQPVINWSVDGQFALGKGGATFIMGRLIDNGLLKQFLDDHCAAGNYRLCLYKDSLPPTSRAFHWESNSPLYKEGGWGAPEAEYRKIVFATLTSPKYFALHLWKSAIATPTQLMQNAVGSGLDYKWYRSKESPPYQAVVNYFPHEFNEYRYARQCGNLWKQELDFTFLNKVQFWALLISLACMVWLYPACPPAWKTAVVVLGCGIVANAFITAGMAVICDRFPSRVAWMLVLLACMALRSTRFVNRP